jgi:hypothetical protein
VGAGRILRNLDLNQAGDDEGGGGAADRSRRGDKSAAQGTAHGDAATTPLPERVRTVSPLLIFFPLPSATFASFSCCSSMLLPEKVCWAFFSFPHLLFFTLIDQLEYMFLFQGKLYHQISFMLLLDIREMIWKAYILRYSYAC